MRLRFLFIAIFTGSIVLSAQPGIRFSVFANPCINWFQSDTKNVISEGATVGFDAGLTIDKYFAENYAFTSGISIGSLGGNLNYKTATNFRTAEKDVNLVPANSSVKFNLQYITIPMGLKFKTKEIGYSTFFAHLGLTSQINIKAKASSSENNPILDGDNISKDISAFNLGYHFGGGIQYSLGGNTALVLGLTFTNGFIDLTHQSNDAITSSSLAIRLGILF